MFWLDCSTELISGFSYTQNCVNKLSSMPVAYSKDVSVRLQGCLSHKPSKGAAPQF